MNGMRWQPRPEIEMNRDAALIHEYLLSAAGSGAWGPAGDLIVALLDQHQPHHPPVASMFAAEHGQPVCRGCDRAELSPTRDPAWPCSTYRTIAHLWFPETQTPEHMAHMLIHLDEYRSPAARGAVAARHRDARSADTGATHERSAGMQLVRTEPVACDLDRGGR